VIAVLLGWLLLHEPVHPRTFIAMGMILGAVVWIQFSHKLAVGRSGGRAVATDADTLRAVTDRPPSRAPQTEEQPS